MGIKRKTILSIPKKLLLLLVVLVLSLNTCGILFAGLATAAPSLQTFQFDNDVKTDGGNEVITENYYLVSSNGSIVLTKDGTSGTYTLDTTTDTGDGSIYKLTVNSSDKTKGKLKTVTCTGAATNGTGQKKCSDPKTEDVILQPDDDPKVSKQATGTTKIDKSLTDSCYDALPIFGWAICWVIDIADSMYGFMKDRVYDLLYIPETAYNNTDCTNGCLKNSWTVVKNLATVGLVLVALVMIASQIFSFEFVSAYTIKKVIPRLVIATILMQLSWFIFTTLIQITNAVGFGLYSLIIGAFGATDIVSLLGEANTLGEKYTLGAASGITIVGVAGGAAALGFSLLEGGMALTYVVAMIGVIISIFLAIATLVVRKMLIMILLVLSPIALLAWILPGTQKFWSSWWNLFSKLLLMMPLITLLFAAGAISSKIIMSSSQDQTFSMIAAIIAYFAPLFLITATFKFAGGIFTNIQDIMNKGGDKFKNSGMFGLKDEAKFRKENSGWAMAKRDKLEMKSRTARNRYAERITGTEGKPGEPRTTLQKTRTSLLQASVRSKDLDGDTKASLEGAMSSAASLIKADVDKRLADKSNLVDFQVSTIRDSYKKNALGQWLIPDARGVVVPMDKKAATRRVNAMMIGNGLGDTSDVNGISVERDIDTLTQLTLKSYADKDGDNQNAYNFAHSPEGSLALLNDAQTNENDKALMQTYMPSSYKALWNDHSTPGDETRILTYTHEAYDLGIQNYNTQSHDQDKKDIVQAVRTHLAADEKAGLASLTRMVRAASFTSDDGRNVKTQFASHGDLRFANVDFDTLKANEKATLVQNASGDFEVKLN